MWKESVHNRLIVLQTVVELKDRYDDMAEKLLTEGDTDGYSCTPEYKGGSFIPSKPMIAATKDRMPVFAVKKLKRKHRKRVSAS